LKITTKGRYALRIMVDLAQQPADEFTALRNIAERQGISEKYSEMIISLLCKDGLVISSRGKGGGYKLSKTIDNYSVGDVLRASEGSLAPVSCLEQPENACPRAGNCESLPMWKELDRLIEDYLDSVPITDLVRQAQLGAQSGACIGSMLP